MGESNEVDSADKQRKASINRAFEKLMEKLRKIKLEPDDFGLVIRRARAIEAQVQVVSDQKKQVRSTE